MDNLINVLGLVGGIMLPLFNVPLIYKIIKRKSSNDLSLVWVVGVWICIVMMTPSGFQSEDIVWRTYSYFNIILFTGVVFTAIKYRSKNGGV